MEDLEKDLQDLKFAPPPPWAKARSLMAAENVFRAQARRTRMRCIGVALIAAAIALVVVGTRIADMIAPLSGAGGPYLDLPRERGADMMGPDYSPLPRRPAVRPRETEKPDVKKTTDTQAVESAAKGPGGEQGEKKDAAEKEDEEREDEGEGQIDAEGP